MDRKEIKELAKTKIKGNIWNLLWPFLCISVISGIGSRLGGGTVTYDAATMKYTSTVSPAGSIISILFTILTAVITAGYFKYVLNFVRTGKMNANDIITTIKEKWLNLLISYILMGVIIFACSLLLVIPGLIMALAYSFVTYLVIDSDVSGTDALKKGREMMKGYKMDYFVFLLSFFGWFLLGVCTCGIGLIWVLPYYYVANTIYYEKLKEKTK
ncbi:MAG: DUF975 family protein [Bacilli bacterium]|nr:DUF975 family protein [Bacilli bacterium]